ncbi:uncharacterized protein LOC115044553 [Echeneis naucrates]|uniref:uncharacterized protein LOC115044553 n=1 Tax=Echeneis naucrates TaxID=173247 RepID=UPI001113F543|nr:uncharacterized protein LOC115044553 [Echeneis naucrates]
MDPESLQKSGRRRGACLDVCLVMSIIFLFMALTVVTVVGWMVAMGLQSELKLRSANVEAKTSFLRGPTANPAFKMEKFVYLEATSSILKNSTMAWDSVDYAAGSSVGSNFHFDSVKQSLTPVQAGTYFIYVELNLTCTYNCSAGVLSVHVGDKLTCKVELPAGVISTPVSRKCWTVNQLQKEPLFTQMAVSQELKDWKLLFKGSGLGMFQVD